MRSTVTVAIPTLNAGLALGDTLAAVGRQRVDRELELLVCDSGSTDDTVARARACGARVIEIPRAEFSHGPTRNLLMSRARGDHVAFLSQDAVPAGDGWLAALLSGFSAAPSVGLTFGPYRAPAGVSLSVARELDSWFASFSDGGVRVDVLAPGERDLPARAFLGHRGFFTDANGCVARQAWKRVPFPPVAYAEDHRLAQEMLRAGFAKVYVPEAAVIHAHEYSAWGWLRRSFDESRAVREVYGFAERPRALALTLRGGVAGDLRAFRAAAPGDVPGIVDQLALFVAALVHHGARGTGALLGPRSRRLPAAIVRRLSLEGRV